MQRCWIKLDRPNLSMWRGDSSCTNDHTTAGRWTDAEKELHCNIHLTYTPFTLTAHTNIMQSHAPFERNAFNAVLSKLNVWFALTHLLVRGPMKGLVISCTVALEANNRPTFTFSFRSWSSALGQSDPFWGADTEVGAGVIGPAVLICGLKPVRRVVLSYKDTMLWKVPDGGRGDMEWFRTTWAASSSAVYR